MRIEIGEELDGLMIRKYLRETLGMSAALVKHLKFSESGILVNGRRENVRYVLKKGDILSLATEDTESETSPYVVPSPLDVGILYEDPDLLVISKPSGMPSHPSRGHALDTVANALAYRYQDRPYVFRPANRLDKDTSGLMVVALSRLAADHCSRNLRAGKVFKVYLALLDGVLNSPCGRRDSYIRRASEEDLRREECPMDSPGAKRAVSVYRVLLETEGHSLVLASPLTGRTHQLRVHFAAMGCPIHGDPVYGTEDAAFPRQALHALSLEMPHPVTGEKLSFFCPPPEDMTSLLDRLTDERWREDPLLSGGALFHEVFEDEKRD